MTTHEVIRVIHCQVMRVLRSIITIISRQWKLVVVQPQIGWIIKMRMNLM